MEEKMMPKIYYSVEDGQEIMLEKFYDFPEAVRCAEQPPHLEDKLKGTVMILSALKNRPDLDPCRVLVDHCEEHTFPLVKEAGYWAGLTLYPTSKLNPKRAADILELYGMDRVWANSAADWGDSDPLALTALACELRRRGFSRQETERLLLENPETFMGQSPKFRKVSSR